MRDFSTVEYFLIIEERIPLNSADTPSSSVKNHGIPEETIHGVSAAAETFFALPNDRKMKVRYLLIAPRYANASVKHPT